jgi:hypothetical protein
MKANKKKAPRTDFSSKHLVDHLVRKGYEADARWFEHVAYKFREEFAMKYATKTWNVCPNGNPTAIVISYPRHDGTVRVFDLDSAEVYWVPLSKFTQKRISGRNHNRNYECSGVVLDDFRSESEDIQDHIDWESLAEFDRLQKLTPAQRRKEESYYGRRGPMLGGERVRKIISLPK